MKEVNILTLCGGRYERNIGNVLQSYALGKILKKPAFRSVLIYFRKESLKKKVIKFLRKFKWFVIDTISRRRKIKRFTFNINADKRRRDRLFDNFYRHIKVKKKNYGFKYDSDTYYVCGSDQIWNPSYAGIPEFFAYGAEHGIAYAASFGVGELEEDVRERYSKYLKEMDYISVREDRAAELVYELTGREVPVVLDPTMLLNREEWNKVGKKPKFETGKFILTYFLGECEAKYAEYITELAEKSGCEIINLELLNANEYWYNTGPGEFLWLVNHCEFMCTDSFHGSVFSIINEKPFMVFERIDGEKPMNSRLDTLLSKFNLTDRKYTGQGIEEINNIDYGKVNTILEQEKKKSIDFLKNALGVIENG